jgi:hypothetical protein
VEWPRVIGPHPGRVIPVVFVPASAPRPAQGTVC